MVSAKKNLGLFTIAFYREISSDERMKMAEALNETLLEYSKFRNSMLFRANNKIKTIYYIRITKYRRWWNYKKYMVQL